MNYKDDTRKVVLDLETTGIDVSRGDRVISIGMVELIDDLPTGKTFYQVVNPEKEFLDEEQTKVHGFVLQDLIDKPKFADIAEEVLSFIGDSQVIIHNVYFDTLFLKKEFEIAGYESNQILNNTLCTVEMARNVLPIYRVSLDRLCSYFQIPTSRSKTFHSAIEDAQLLSKVYFFLKRSSQSTTTIFDIVEDLNLKKNSFSDRKRIVRVDLEGLKKFRDLSSSFSED